MATPAYTIKPVRTADDIAAVLPLFRAYALSLSVDLSYQNFEEELAGLPGKYAPTSGELLVAFDQQAKAVGCVALRSLQADKCEMKRLYVSTDTRGTGLGISLVDAIVSTARKIGYQHIWLDTLLEMTGAIALYKKLGFKPIPPYYDTPVEDTLFLGKNLSA